MSEHKEWTMSIMTSSTKHDVITKNPRDVLASIARAIETDAATVMFKHGLLLNVGNIVSVWCDPPLNPDDVDEMDA